MGDYERFILLCQNWCKCFEDNEITLNLSNTLKYSTSLTGSRETTNWNDAGMILPYIVIWNDVFYKMFKHFYSFLIKQIDICFYQTAKNFNFALFYVCKH